jgi:hypothetical protein
MHALLLLATLARADTPADVPPDDLAADDSGESAAETRLRRIRGGHHARRGRTLSRVGLVVTPVGIAATLGGAVLIREHDGNGGMLGLGLLSAIGGVGLTGLVGAPALALGSAWETRGARELGCPVVRSVPEDAVLAAAGPLTVSVGTWVTARENPEGLTIAAAGWGAALLRHAAVTRRLPACGGV